MIYGTLVAQQNIFVGHYNYCENLEYFYAHY